VHREDIFNHIKSVFLLVWPPPSSTWSVPASTSNEFDTPGLGGHSHDLFLKQQPLPPHPPRPPLTWVHGIGAHPLGLAHARQLLGEVDVGQLAAAIGEEGQQVVVEVLEVQLLVLVAGAGERDHTAGRALPQPGQQRVGEQEVAQVVHPETHAEAVVRPVQHAGHGWRGREEEGKQMMMMMMMMSIKIQMRPSL